MSPTGSSVEGCGGQVTRPVSLVEPFARSAEASPDKLCLRFEGEDWSNGRLLDRAGSFAAALRAWGLKPGDRVALFLGNHPDFLAAYLGTHLARGVTVPVNKSYRRTELRHIFEDAGVRLCVADGEARPELERVRDDLSSLERVVVRGDDPVTPGAALADSGLASENCPFMAPDSTTGICAFSANAFMIRRTSAALAVTLIGPPPNGRSARPRGGAAARRV